MSYKISDRAKELNKKLFIIPDMNNNIATRVNLAADQ